MIISWILVAAAALTDWWAVENDRPKVELFAKPLVMVFLIGAVLAIDAEPDHARWWFVAALAAGLIGDILLLPHINNFIGGLAAFALGHGLYLGGLSMMAVQGVPLLVGLATGAILVAVVARPIVNALRGHKLAVPVNIYIALSAAVVALASASGRWLLAAGAIAFALSDALLGSDKFVQPAPHRRVWIHRLYHLGQAGLVAGLAI